MGGHHIPFVSHIHTERESEDDHRVGGKKVGDLTDLTSEVAKSEKV